MSESIEDNDQRLGRFMLSADCGINAEELANACRRLGISGPLEPLLRELKVRENAPVAKDSPRKLTQKKEKRLSSKTRESPDFDINIQPKGNKNSYGQESWGRDSGARDLSPEPHRMHENLNADDQLMDNEPGGTSAMLQLASKVS